MLTCRLLLLFFPLRNLHFLLHSSIPFYYILRIFQNAIPAKLRTDSAHAFPFLMLEYGVLR